MWAFELSKWYGDCVSDQGTAFIGYWARVRWGPLVLPYAATLVKVQGQDTQERHTLVPCPEPVVRAPELHWDAKRIWAQGVWHVQVPGHSHRLVESPEGSIDWNCQAPKAECRIDLADGTRISGLGYAEHMRLTIRPWQLPFDELCWGRFLAADDALVWIELRGRHPRQWVFYNGHEEPWPSTIDPNRIVLPDDRGTLELTDSVVLREGRLLTGPLRAIPAASLLLRGGLRHANESKWLSRGTFTTPTRTSSGWAVHEVVRLTRGEPC